MSTRTVQQQHAPAPALTPAQFKAKYADRVRVGKTEKDKGRKAKGDKA